MAADLYPCVLWRDRPHPFSVVLGPKELERYTTTLDPRDGRSLNAAIDAAVCRHWPRRDKTSYQLDVYTAAGTLVCQYRYTPWLAEEASYLA